METEFKIIQVLKSRKGENQQALVFKVQWINTKEIAYMQFDMAKKKYPHIVLDYLVSKIKQKPITDKVVSPVQPKKSVVSPQTQISDTVVICQYKQKKQYANPIDKFFNTCVFCDSQQLCTKILDYDAIVPMDSNMAYPVFFKLQGRHKEKIRRGVEQIKSQGQRISRQKSISNS